MFVGAGIGAYGFAMFHLVTHAFFKALLFLAAGLVIHHLDGEQDIRKMGGLAQVDAVHARDLPDRHARARRHPDLRRLLVEGRDPRSALAEGGALGWTLYVGGLARGAAHRPLRVPPLLPGLPRRARADCRARRRRPTHHGEGPRSMLVPVGRARGRLDGRRPPRDPGRLGARSRTWLDPVVEPLVDPSTAQEWLTSAFAVTLGVARHLPRLARVPRGARARPRRARCGRRSSTSSGSTSSTTRVFSRPARRSRCCSATGSRHRSSRAASTRSPRRRCAAATLTSSIQSGLLRTYALAFTVSVAVLTLVFLVVR